MKKLSFREKIFIIVGGTVLGLFFLTFFVFRPLAQKHERYQTDIKKLRRDVQLFERLKKEYLVLKTKSEQVDQKLRSRKKSFTLFS
ncbi:MAG TPA: hypothetical protein ENG51_17285, partial [Deltaproteobacteria bacterium]|nr:hypothetical protein [Deltaproteobacteria bacterium]